MRLMLSFGFFLCGRIDPDAVEPPFVHFTCPSPDQWDLWTYERFQAACDEVRAAWDESEPRGLEVELELGIQF